MRNWIEARRTVFVRPEDVAALARELASPSGSFLAAKRGEPGDRIRLAIRVTPTSGLVELDCWIVARGPVFRPGVFVRVEQWDRRIARELEILASELDTEEEHTGPECVVDGLALARLCAGERVLARLAGEANVGQLLPLRQEHAVGNSVAQARVLELVDHAGERCAIVSLAAVAPPAELRVSAG